jgi:arabinofuranosyltransferase
MGQFDPPSYNVSTSVPIFGRVIINIFRTTAKTAGLNKSTLTQFMHQTKQIYSLRDPERAGALKLPDNSVPATPFSAVRIEAAVVLAIGLALFVWNFYANRYFYHDDALISLRYAINFVTSSDLSWNSGDRVEGYTNFLHLIAVAGLIDLGTDPVVASRLVNALGAAGLLAAVWIGLKHLLPAPADAPARMLGVAGVLGAVTVPVWILGGLETIPAAAFLTAGVVSLLSSFGVVHPERLRGAIIGGVFFALAYLTRPDAVMMNLAAGLGVLAFGRASFWRRFAQCFIVGAIPLMVIGLHVWWRTGYYDDLLPNTFHAKVGVDLATRMADVWRYLYRSAVLAIPAVTLGVLMLPLILGRRIWRMRLGRIAAYLAGCVLAQGIYVIWSGGDHMPAARVLAGVIGPGCLLLGLGAATLGRGARQIVIIASLSVMVLAAFQSRPLGMNPAAYIGRIVGSYIADTWPEGSVVALNTAGSTPFMAQNNVYIDMLGLNDREIGTREDVPIRTARQSMSGHSKGDGASVLRRTPDYIILGPAEGRPATDPWFLSDLEISESPDFKACYAMHQIELPRDKSWPAGPAPVQASLTFTYYKRMCGAAS